MRNIFVLSYNLPQTSFNIMSKRAIKLIRQTELYGMTSSFMDLYVVPINEMESEIILK